ncbi:ABC transporter ATP-binding protein [Jiangella muralis]|uniref:ABC transporter ATP-binding protein n=1 Tax=Jiangella muralis TaxID=702383 RepID=UPI00146FFEC9|nr:ABC transporter ATP-binding protein [Jiangella muralis]
MMSAAQTSRTPVLSVEDLSVEYVTAGAAYPALSGVTLELAPGEFLGVVGESGCGKSTLAAAALGLLPANADSRGSIRFDGEPLAGMSSTRLRELRGGDVGLIPQDPLASLDPTFSVGSQIVETLRAHQRIARRAAKARAVELMDTVGIDRPAERFGQPPRAFSGGMRQRIAIAIAVANTPRLLIADEPTTALDVTVQAQVLRLLTRLAKDRNMAVLFISHDLHVVTQLCDRVAVLYAGKLSEVGPARDVMDHPAHPYTAALLASIPQGRTTGRLPSIPGEIGQAALLPGCRFAPRCAHRMPVCDTEPPLAARDRGGVAACWLAASSAPATLAEAGPVAASRRDVQSGGRKDVP